MNSRLFSIGMFPYIGLATLPLFCESDWPKQLYKRFRDFLAKRNEETPEGKPATVKQRLFEKSSPRHKLVTVAIFFYCGLQCFLPYSHFITKGYNNWTNGLYGYSWDMMVHAWDTVLVVVKVVDNKSGQEHFLDPEAWAPNGRWSKHADMCVQYAECVKRNLMIDYERK